MPKLLSINIIYLFFLSTPLCAQKVDSTLETLQQIPVKYLTTIDKKATHYTNLITSKTEKTLTRLSKWENKIHNILLKTSPETAARLFGNNQPTFGSLLEEIKKGEALSIQYQAPYNKYRDDVTTSLKYLALQKEQLDSLMINKVRATGNKMKDLSTEEDKSEVMQEFIKERKKQIKEQAFLQIGKSKYLLKINKEAYYYTETLQNYKELFASSEKTEETVKGILSRIPAFKKFSEGNSQLAGLFASPSSFPGISNGNTIPIVNGIPSRAALQSFMQTGLSPANTSPLEQLQVPDGKEGADEWQKKITDIKGLSGKEIPDFKPNSQHSKPFKKRLEYGIDFQFNQSENTHPTIANIAAKVGYKFTDKFSSGIGLNYVLGLGKGWDKIQISNEGIGIRSYIKWNLTKGFDIQGGSEWNHQKFLNFSQLKIKEQWQQAGLVGVAKNYSLRKKMKGSIQILYDFLASQHLPASQPILFRFGYGFN